MSSRLPFRPDIEGLRAIAVALVILFHIGVPGFGGGFVGVDVFYVISGFLITRLLLAEFAGSATISLPGFYARRARRILPGAILVLAATLAGSWLLLPPLEIPEVARDVAASGLYVGNFRFAARATDYLNVDGSPSPVLHYWSLAVEEQFYALWPALLLVILGLARRARLLLPMFAAASLIGCVWLTRVSQPWAFFSLPPRAWELLVGAGLAFGASRLSAIPRAAAWCAGWAGAGLLAVATVTVGETTPYPGIAATLPVAGAAFILTAGAGTSPVGVGRALSLRPMQAVGRTSYSLYLWHWPVLTLWAAYVGRRLTWTERVIGIALTVGAAVVSYRLVENPIRRSPVFINRRAAITLGIGAPATICLLAILVSVGLVAQRGGDVLPADLRPPLAETRRDKPLTYLDGCHLPYPETSPRSCVYGEPDSSTTVVLFGDSHAAQWFPTLHAIAEARSWRLVSMTKVACPVPDLKTMLNAFRRPYSECVRWRRAAFDRIADEQPDIVVAASSPTNVVLADGTKPGTPTFLREWRAGLERTLGTLSDASGRVLMVADLGRNEEDVPACLSRRHLASACTTPVDARPRFTHAVDRGAAVSAGVDYLDPTSWVCPDGACPPIRGSVLVYRDSHHLTTVFASDLTPRWTMILLPLIGDRTDSSQRARR